MLPSNTFDNLCADWCCLCQASTECPGPTEHRSTSSSRHPQVPRDQWNHYFSHDSRWNGIYLAVRKEPHSSSICESGWDRIQYFHSRVFFLSIMSMHWFDFFFGLVNIILSSNAMYFNLRNTHKNKSYFIPILLHVSSSLYIFNSESMLFFIAKSGSMITTRYETSFHLKTSLW